MTCAVVELPLRVRSVVEWIFSFFTCVFSSTACIWFTWLAPLYLFKEFFVENERKMQLTPFCGYSGAGSGDSA
jgi:hypothetical protein